MGSISSSLTWFEHLVAECHHILMIGEIIAEVLAGEKLYSQRLTSLNNSERDQLYLCEISE